MRYDKYVNKMKTALATKKYISRHKIAILIVSAIILVLTLSFLFTSGTVTSVEVPTEFVYGEEIEVKGSALFKKVTYEYKHADSDEWTEVEPTAPGTYQVRVAAEKIIGKKSYSKPQEFVIKPKEVTVTIVTDTIAFGEKPTVSADLEEGDRIVYADFVYENFALNKTNVSVIVESIIVHNHAGEDVTSAYTFISSTAEITFNSKNLVVNVSNASKIYDGTPLTSNEFTVNENGLLEGHVGQLTTNASITNVAFGN